MNLGSGRVAVIAEAGVNHNGDPGLAHRLIDAAAATGSDAVKFQTFRADAVASEGAERATYQRRAGDSAQREMLEALELPLGAWRDLRDHAVDSGLVFLSTPFDIQSAEMLVGLDVPLLKVGSGELTNLPFLEALASLGRPLLVSTGMSDLDEVSAAVHAAGSAPDLTLMHCVSAYPAPIRESNLRVIPEMIARFGLEVGWSDHTPGSTAAVAAVALGATLVEKHLTLDRAMTGPDHAASLDPEGMRGYAQAVRDAADALGDGVKRRQPSEEDTARHARRSWHAGRDVAAGVILGEGDVELLRPEDGLAPALSPVGRRTIRPLGAGHPIRASDLGAR